MEYIYPITVELEYLQNDEWVVANQTSISSKKELTEKVQEWVMWYGLNKRTYQIHVYAQSKANKILRGIVDDLPKKKIK